MKVDGSLKSLIQGVSQQPARSRIPGQCTAQDNFSSNPVDGLTRRPPLDYIANLFAGTGAQFYNYTIGSNDYIIAARAGSLRVFDINGVEKTVNSSAGPNAYLDGSELAFTTLDGVTYISNKTKKPTMLGTTASYVQTGAIVYVLGGQYGRKYTVDIDWSGTTISVSWTAPDGGSAAHSTQISTDNIATQVTAALNANATFTSNFSATRVSDCIYIKKTAAPTTEVFQVSVGDGDGGNNMFVVNNTINDAAKLPRFAPKGYIVSITGYGGAGEDDWYLEFQTTDTSVTLGNGFGLEGIWAETVAPDTPYLLDQTTMPHVLTYNSGTDQFTFAVGSWAGRQVGNTVSNEDPSFIGNPVEDMGYFQGRLVFLAGPAVIMSRTDRPLDFWVESATVQADTDPIDIQSTANGVTKMLRVIPHNRDLVIFSDKGQFIVFGRNSLTPKNSSLVLTTAFEAELNARPVPAGRNVFFGINYGKFTGVREFYTEGSQDINDSRPITQHVLKYIPGKVRHMASSSNFDILLVQTVADLSKLYVYEYIWKDTAKVQSSWSRWSLPNNVAYFFLLESQIYAISSVSGNYVLEVMDLDPQDDEGLTYQVKLDRKVTVAGVNTTISNPLPQMPSLSDMVFVQGAGCPNPGLRVTVKSSTLSTITFNDDLLGGSVICGQRYRSSYKPTMPIVKDQDGVKVGSGKLVISKFFVNCRDSGSLDAIKTSKYREDESVHFSGLTVGDPESIIGEPPIADGAYIIPFRDNSDYAEIEIYTDSHLPLTMMDIEWIGQYTKRGRRIQQGG